MFTGKNKSHVQMSQTFHKCVSVINVLVNCVETVYLIVHASVRIVWKTLRADRFCNNGKCAIRLR